MDSVSIAAIGIGLLFVGTMFLVWPMFVIGLILCIAAAIIDSKSNQKES